VENKKKPAQRGLFPFPDTHRCHNKDSAMHGTAVFDPDRPDRNIVRRCRALTLQGEPCRKAAVIDYDYCTRHIDRAPRTFERPGHIVIPLLEDHAAVQLVCTKTLHGLLNGHITPQVANAANRCCAIATSTFPRPARLKPGESAEPAPSPLPGIALDEWGNYIAPRLPWIGPSGQPARYDDPQPGAAAFHFEEPDPTVELVNGYKRVILDLMRHRSARRAEETAAALGAGLPDPHPNAPPAPATDYVGTCPFGTDWCDGPWYPHHCACCTGELQLSPSDPSFPGDDIVALLAILRPHLQRLREREEQEENHPSTHLARSKQPSGTEQTSAAEPPFEETADPRLAPRAAQLIGEREADARLPQNGQNGKQDPSPGILCLQASSPQDNPSRISNRTAPSRTPRVPHREQPRAPHIPSPRSETIPGAPHPWFWDGCIAHKRDSALLLARKQPRVPHIPGFGMGLSRTSAIQLFEGGHRHPPQRHPTL
jgi:hypothetical protein